jgi:hypothetical protein
MLGVKRHRDLIATARDRANAERVSFNAQPATFLDANRKGREPNLRFRMGTGADDRIF